MGKVGYRHLGFFLDLFGPCDPVGVLKIFCFFTHIPCTYTSLPLDGMARNYYLFFNYIDTQDHAIYHVWIHFFPTSYARAQLCSGGVLEMRRLTLAVTWQPPGWSSRDTSWPCRSPGQPRCPTSVRPSCLPRVAPKQADSTCKIRLKLTGGLHQFPGI